MTKTILRIAGLVAVAALVGCGESEEKRLLKLAQQSLAYRQTRQGPEPQSARASKAVWGRRDVPSDHPDLFAFLAASSAAPARRALSVQIGGG
jgi:hypothetical protein